MRALIVQDFGSFKKGEIRSFGEFVFQKLRHRGLVEPAPVAESKEVQEEKKEKPVRQPKEKPAVKRVKKVKK